MRSIKVDCSEMSEYKERRCSNCKHLIVVDTDDGDLYGCYKGAIGYMKYCDCYEEQKEESE